MPRKYSFDTVERPFRFVECTFRCVECPFRSVERKKQCVCVAFSSLAKPKREAMFAEKYRLFMGKNSSEQGAITLKIRLYVIKHTNFVE